MRLTHTHMHTCTCTDTHTHTQCGGRNTGRRMEKEILGKFLTDTLSLVCSVQTGSVCVTVSYQIKLVELAFRKDAGLPTGELVPDTEHLRKNNYQASPSSST